MREDFFSVSSSALNPDGTGSLQENGKPTVLGFGRQYAELYGIGQSYDMTHELSTENQRFSKQVDDETVPAVIRDRIARMNAKSAATAAGGGKGLVKTHTSKSLLWKGSEELAASDPAQLELIAKKVNRSKLVYSGISS